MKFLVRQEVHKALEHADMILDYILVIPDDGYVFSLYTSFIIRIAHLVTAGLVFKGYGEIVSFAQLIMNFRQYSLPIFSLIYLERR